jgi:hypothetical protein
MALVQISDIIEPRVFTAYLQKLTTQLSAFVQSGVIERSPLFDELLVGGGRTFDLPHYNDLADTEANVSTDDPVGADDAVPEKITTGREVAQRHNRNQVWSASDLASALAGNDPMEAIARRVAAYWVRQEQTYLIRSLQGVILDNIAADSGDMVHDIGAVGAATITAANLFSAEAFIDAAQTMGDHSDAIVAVAMHSVVYTRAQKNNLIDFIPDARGETEIPTFLGRRVIVDDGIPTSTPDTQLEYSTYLFGEGAFAQGIGSPRVPVEVNREPIAGRGGGQEFLHSRVEWLLHPRGFSWIAGSQVDSSPTNAELALAANWNRTFLSTDDRKLIKLAELKTNG